MLSSTVLNQHNTPQYSNPPSVQTSFRRPPQHVENPIFIRSGDLNTARPTGIDFYPVKGVRSDNQSHNSEQNLSPRILDLRRLRATQGNCITKPQALVNKLTQNRSNTSG